jgi:hypothetical protein
MSLAIVPSVSIGLPNQHHSDAAGRSYTGQLSISVIRYSDAAAKLARWIARRESKTGSGDYD